MIDYEHNYYPLLRLLPIRAPFNCLLHQQTEAMPRHCKECRKAASRKQRKTDHDSQTVRNHELYPVITRIENSELRISFILHALQVVAESQARKRKREQEYADEDENL